MMSFLQENSVSIVEKSDLKDVVVKGCERASELNSKSCCIVDLGRVVKAVHDWKKMYPKVSPILKAGNVPDGVLNNFLSLLKVKLTSATGSELEKLVNSGVKPEHVIYNGLCKINRHIRTAQSLGITDLTFSTVKELERVVAIYPKANLTFRLYNSDGASGIDSECLLQMTNEAMVRAKQLKVKVIGLSLDLNPVAGVDEFDFAAWCKLADLLISSVVEMNVGLKSVDFGSGVEIEAFTDPNSSEDREQVNALIGKYSSLQFSAQPNAFILGSSALICCSVTSVKRSTDDHIFYYLNDGVYGSFSKCAFSKLTSSPIFFKRSGSTEEVDESSTKATFWGPTCDSMDKICHVQDCPVLTIGDLVVFDTMGCQSVAAATTFNGFPPPFSLHCFSLENLCHAEFLSF